MSTSASSATSGVAPATDAVAPDAVAGEVQWPTETEIYILPDGRVVVADLPAELNRLAAALGTIESGEIAPHAQPDSPL